MQVPEEEVIDLIDFSRTRQSPNTTELPCRYTPRTLIGENVFKSLQPDDHPETIYQPPCDELENKVVAFLGQVKERQSSLGGMIFKGNENQTPLELFMDCISKGNHRLSFVARGRRYQLFVDDNLVVETYNVNFNIFIKPLVDAAFDILQNECFIIMQTVLYESITEEDIAKAEDPNHQNWVYTTKPEVFIEIVVRETWGGNSHNKILMSNIENIIKRFAYSDSLSLLCFDTDFTTAERRSIHNISKELKLKCQDVGTGIEMRTKVFKHYSREDLVRILLRSKCEKTVYRLVIPPQFLNHWSEIINPNEPA
ncbi:uncharacterized protein LOC126264565 [Aethina tumida]|uniref:uncharacterized protein LOC126264565 n=1 Tax=Aethina tumida TaxID=116153 RepID=UPI00214887DE|nr:uncharacterized protein LOC126264565 [Aethina tumida]XP_049818977.1 uncharacterized protein LOC126264565 [Aethina tumida]XP_049818978.1 uncharacterized protein LOC126264565 [Aethina tumida]